MSPLVRILHSTARAVADFVCAPAPPPAGNVPAAGSEHALASTATIYLRLVAAHGGLPVSSNPAKYCARCANSNQHAHHATQPPQPTSPPRAQRAYHRAEHASDPDGSDAPDDGSPSARTPRRRERHRRERRARAPLTYPPAPRLSWSPPAPASPFLDAAEAESPASALHGLGLGFQIPGLGLGVLPRRASAEQDEHSDARGPPALTYDALGFQMPALELGVLPRRAGQHASLAARTPSRQFVQDIAAAYAQDDAFSPPDLSHGSLSSAPSTASPPSFVSSRHATSPDSARAFNADSDGDDDADFFSRPRPRPPVRKLKLRRARPVPASPSDTCSTLFSDAPSDARKPRAPLSIARPAPSRTRSPRNSAASFDQDTAASAARRVTRAASVGSLGRPWK